MIILRAIPLSFAILWRYLLVLPFVILALIVFGAICVMFAFISAIVSPVLAILVVLAFTIAASTIPVMVGTRLGLQAQEIIPKNGYMGLLGPAMGYGLFEGISVLIILSGAFALYLVATPMTAAGLMAALEGPEDSVLPALLAVSPATTLTLVGLTGFAIITLRAALLVPLTGASVGFDPEGRTHTPFYGFGVNLLPLLLLVAVTYGLWALVMPLAGAIFAQLGYVDAFLSIMAQLEEPGADFWEVASTYSTELTILVGGSVLAYVWVLSLQCAGAAAAFRKLMNRTDEARRAFEQAVEEDLVQARPPRNDPEMMDLVRSRMPTKRYSD